MKTETQLKESIDRFQHVFWGKNNDKRPPVGVVNTDVYLPVKYLRKPFFRTQVKPSDVRPDMIMTDYEFAFGNRSVNIDDWMPFSAPWRAVPWLEAWCGCTVNYSNGSLAPGHPFESINDLTNTVLPLKNDWFNCLEQQTNLLSQTAPDDCWISPTILRGCSDVLAALRGMEGFCFDLIENPEMVNMNAQRINSLLIKAINMHFSIIKPKYSGYGHIFGYWAPEPTIAIQEDMMGLCNPEAYRDIFMKYNTEIVQLLGKYVLFHFHSTGFQHYKDVLNIPGIAGLQFTIEANGPALEEMVPVFCEILERSRLLIFADNRFDELLQVLPKLPVKGLYVVVPELFIKSDHEFNEFISSVNWRKN